MKIQFYKVVLYLQLINALLLPQHWAIVKPKLFSLKSTKQRLHNTLHTLVPTRQYQREFTFGQLNYNNTENYKNTSNSNLIFIPRELINPEMFSALGLSNLFYNFTNLKWINFTPKDQILIPNEFKTFFIFNTSSIRDSSFIGFNQISNLKNQNNKKFLSTSNLNKILNGVIPFDMPELLELIDYYMILPNLPNLTNLTSSIYSEGLLNYSLDLLPTFRPQLSDNKPMIVFMFNETEPNVESAIFKEDKSTHHIMSIKNYLKPTIISSFFDKFANTWINQVGYDSLIHSVFCNINQKDEDYSYCLKIRNSMVDFLPAFKKFVNKKDPNIISNFHYNCKDPQFNQLAVKQIHDRLKSKKNALEMTSYNLVKYPKQSIELLDEELDDRLDDKLTKIESKKEDWLDKYEEQKIKLMNNLDSKIYSIDDEKDAVGDLLKRKKKFISNLKFKPQIFDKSVAYELDSDEESDELEDEDEDEQNENSDNEDIYKNDHSYISKRSDYNHIIQTQPLKYQDDSIGNYIEDEGFSIPLSLLKDIYKDKSTSISTSSNQPPRKTTYSQIINLDTLKPLLKKRFEIVDKYDSDGSILNQDCKPITWYNIFHYSLFGEPKFCKSKEEEDESKKVN
ncbi:uncharacterized protein KGF55_003535 [Candida pseudojiufengensis]|uniref:uncharacterized protein n=1 Tax=Candida pseudojiufengensis TaxID=497109 RepID=UPI00222574E9|nr:uncharacterized protein KGF55_003535 [Candida pseudojiufengensis]KAI5962459.1 hypothetical protein KGF55_003535 [Candida pseudojiufengensis]